MPKILTLTPEQLKEIAESKLIGKIIAETYGISIKTVYAIKKKAGTGIGIGRNTAHEGKMTPELKEEILTSKLDFKELSAKTGFSISYLCRFRKKHGVGYKLKEPKPRTYNPRPSVKKEKSPKLPVLKVKHASAKNTEFREHKRAEEHERKMELFREKEAQKSSWPWIYCKETRSYTRKKPELKTA